MKNLFFIFIVLFNSNCTFSQNYSNVECLAPNPTFSLGSYKNVLIYGGYDSMCNVKINKIAAWNDTIWTSFGNGITPPTFGWPAKAFVEFKGELIVAGGFQYAGFKNVNKIARWDGIDWYPLGSGLNAQLATELFSALIVYNGELYAAGRFNEINGLKNVNNIARWDGTTWKRVGTGLQGSLAEVYSMAVYKNELYVGGRFLDAGGVTAYNIAKWNGTTWSSVGLGTNEQIMKLYVDTLRNLLYVGGGFTRVNGSIPASCIATWDGINWSAMGNKTFTIDVSSMELYHGYLYAGGLKFTDTCFARWDGTTWEVINGPNGNVTSLQTYKNKLYLGGDFTMIGNDSIQYLASYYSADSVAIGIDNSKRKDNISLYPNPSSCHLKIESSVEFKYYEIYTLLSKQVQIGEIINQEINTSELLPGMYILKVLNKAGQVIQQRFVKE